MQQKLPETNLNLSSNPTVESSALDHSLASYDYELPNELIAQNPAFPRDSSRLLVVNSPSTGKNTEPLHYIFRDLPDLLRAGDLLVMNNTRVLSARLYGRKSTGAEVEVLLLEERQHNCWLALVKPGKRFKHGSKIIFEAKEVGEDAENLSKTFPMPSQLTATVLETDEATGGRLLQFDLPEEISLVQLLDVFGEVPLPPYITQTDAESEQYQTVYAKSPGAIAAPTAGLHFTPELLERLRQKGINQAFVTLHVGVGTFRPVEVEDVTTHKMHEEWIEVPAATVEQIRATQAAGGRVIAVGTTVVRSLEGAATSGELQPFCGKTDLFIYPGYKWRVVEGLITNFHLPRSSLLMLVSALIGRQRLLNIYQQAIASQYRFYSFGDAMLILPEADISDEYTEKPVLT
ncbi:MAG: tRNA preQ1(34) S-adenosylmethionine ribosyltransferase-isomerase QueA [Chlorogloeopsis fritschii C42_A2020_084]|uniref:tRNA preQ1(34) S-adenosylmethionine ribosyltransferase-isomerase QueA n=1 Tax=Chlorogloeopsis fritschii TaxID=1124 RepID=UPI0019DD0F21|nr:tRNA preQ1(34) S-adenosylmethionine ribosyltransferase-isomerase QueA [Chlorogloeopsis fritschii]MBF2008456.1 tRNA preQ1(34) S-adenosylmethionine ribosyltransferase-isomerase QueA [Chlorogloeopsis fritschii C42_A2020_084]